MLWLLLDREIGEEERGCCATVPAELQYPVGTVHISAMATARVGGAGNAGRGALPTAGKREGISF